MWGNQKSMIKSSSRKVNARIHTEDALPSANFPTVGPEDDDFCVNDAIFAFVVDEVQLDSCSPTSGFPHQNKTQQST